MTPHGIPLKPDSVSALSGPAYDQLWNELPDFIRHNPGARHRRRKILNLIHNLSFSRVLDVGCGPAELLMTIQQKHPNVKELTGVDISSETVAKLKKALPGFNFLTLNIEKETLTEKFDLIICSEVIEHLGNRALAYTHLAGMLSSGGHLVLTCPTGKIFATERYFGHTTHPTLIEITEAAEKEGLEILKLQNWGWPIYRLLKVATNLDSHWALKNFGTLKYGWFQKTVSSFLYWICFLNWNSKKQGCQIFGLFRKP